MASSSRKQPISARASSSAAGSSSSGKRKMATTGDDMLDALVEVFPQLNFLTLVEVCMEYKDDIDSAADYIIHNVLPSILDDNNANVNEDSHMKGPTSVDNGADSLQSDIANKYTDEEKDSLMGENSDCLVAGALNSKPETSACEDDLATQDDGSTEEKDSLMGENSDCLVSGALNYETSVFEDDLAMQDDGLPVMATQSVYPTRLKSLDNAIGDENDRKVTLMSKVTEISQMLEETKLKEEKSKQAVLESTQAGNDILVKVEELKEMTMLAAEDNDKVVEGEVFAEQSILASEAHGLQARLSNISEESNNYVLIIDEMRHTLQGRLAAADMETALAERVKIDRETLARKMLNEQELLVDAAKKRSKKLEQQVQENTKLRELLMDRVQVVDAFQGEMLGIFDKISQLQLRVQGASNMSCSANSAHNIAELQCKVDEPQHSVDESLQLASPRLSSSFKSTDSTAQAHYTVDEPQVPVEEPQLLVDETEPLLHYTADEPPSPIDEPLLPVDEPLKLASSSSSSSLKSADNIAQLLGRVLDVHFPVDESPQLASSSISNLVKSSDNIVSFEKRVDVDESLQLTSYSLAISEKLAASKSSLSSAVVSNSVFTSDEEIDDASSHDSFPLDDSWDVVDEEAVYMCAN